MVRQETWKCCICGKEYPIEYASDGTPLGIGQNNPDPAFIDIEREAVCCSDCNAMYVIPLRMRRLSLGMLPRIADGDARGQLMSNYND
jgi:hypothetical protein